MYRTGVLVGKGGIKQKGGGEEGVTNNYVLPNTYTPVPQLTVYTVHGACAIVAIFTSREYDCVSIKKNQLLLLERRTIPG